MLRSKRLALWLVLAAVAVLVGLLASGVLSRSTGGRNEVVATLPPSVPTTTERSGVVRATAQFGPGDWGTYGGSYDEIRHSLLTEINKQNVDRLGRVCTIDFRRRSAQIPLGQQSFPIVIGGVIYVTTANDNVFAIDGRTCAVIWHYAPSETGLYTDFGVTANRGVAYCDGRLFLLTLDMRVVSLDARTGRVVAQVPISDAVLGADVAYGYSETQAPICYDHIVLFGASGSDYGVRGFAMAYRTDLTAAWPSPYWIIPPTLQEWRRNGRYIGGGTNWNPVTIDTQTNTVYLTTSNPSPIFLPQVRPGPDPRTDAVVAVDLFTGRQRWWQEQINHDEWGYSTVQPVLLFNVKIGGRQRRVVSVGTKEGTWFMYDAHTGEPIYARVKLLNQNEHPSLVPGRPVLVYPSSIGGLNYSPSSFDPGTGYVVNSEAETASQLTEKKNPASVNAHKVVGDVDNGLSNGSFGQTVPGWHDFGSITAVDAAHGKVVWKLVTSEPGRGGVTTTASGLGFAGEGDGNLIAFDTATGHQLWSFQTGHQIAAGASIYEDRGREYVAITVGGTATSSFGGTASQLQIFALGGSQSQSPAPQLRPQGVAPGFYSPPGQYLSLSAQPHTLELQVVASLNKPYGADTLDGASSGGVTVRIPSGWRLNVSFGNHSRSRADGVAVVGLSSDRPQPGPPAFGGASTGRVGASGVAYFHFTPDREGGYAISSTVPSKEAAGEWIHLDVLPSNSAPEIVVGGVTTAVNVTGKPGG
jgi:PQQ-dependent dehydrogenase (methanol/ethanol family)